MTTNEKDDFVNPIETNIDNKHMLEGLNNEKNPEAILEGGDNEVGLPLFRRPAHYRHTISDLEALLSACKWLM